MDWLSSHWVELVAAIYAVDCLLDFIAPLTPWKWDDTLASWLGSFLAKYFPKKTLPLIILCLSLYGCSTLTRLNSEVTPQAVQSSQETVAATTAPYIPQPYQLPVAILGGYLLALGRQYWKDKTQPKNEQKT